MTVDSSIWGAPLSQYDNMNTRTGAADLSDNDFTDFPPFVKNDFSALGSNPTGGVLSDDTLFVAYYNDGYLSPGGQWNFNHPLDLTIAYTACANPDLPLNDLGAIGTDTFAEKISDSYNFLPPRLDKVWLYKSDSNDPQPIAFINCTGYMTQRPNTSGIYQLTGILHNPLYSNTYPPMFLYYQGGEYDRDNAGWDTTTKKNKININLYMSYWRDFGIRTLFGVIMLYYFDGTYNNNTGIPQNIVQTPVSLHWYESQTTLWKHEHPIIAAYLDVYIRSNVDGTYTDSRRNNYCFVPDLTCNLRFNENWGSLSNGRILQPISNYVKNSKNYFPLFGHMPAGAGVTNTPDVIAAIGNQKLDGTGGVSSTSGILLGTRFVRGGFKNETTSTDGLKSFWCELEGDNDDNLELLRRTAAGYGLFFADDVYDLADSGRDTDRWTDNNMCLGVVNSSGYTDGTYTRGSDNEKANNWGWKTASQSSYDPSRPPPSQPMTYDDITTFNDISNIATLTRRYALTKQDVEDLGSELWEISSDIINNIQNDEWYKYTADIMDTFLVTDPLSCIVSLQKYPLTIPEQSGPVLIKLGKAETSISANITKATAKTYYFTPISIKPRFGNSFIDYEPYTHFELYVPFCGTTELDPRDILGRTLSVNLVVDFNTGTCVAYVLSDSLVIETINGSLAIDIPVTGVDSTTIASNITQGIINTRNARYTHQFGTLGKVASPSGIISNVSNVWGSAQTVLTSENNAKLSEYELTHQPAQPHVIGSASPVGSWAIDFKCRLLIYYPTGGIVDESKVADSSQPTAFDSTVFEQYQSQIGFATVDPVTALGEHYAHTLVCAEKAILNNVTTPNGRPATEPELQLIRQALQEGVILP